MPIINKGKRLTNEALDKISTKYTLVRKREKSEDDYADSKLIVDGKEKKLTNTSKYLLDMITPEEEEQ